MEKIKLSDLVNILFAGKSGNYTINDITDELKESNFFIINRFLSKEYPRQAQFFNNKNTDKATAFDIWYYQLNKSKYTPKWFWQGKRKKEEPNIKNWKILLEHYDMFDENDIHFLIENHKKELMEEINYLLELEKERNK